MRVPPHRKFVLPLACSAVFHMLFLIDDSLVTQLWSMLSHQYFSLAVCSLPVCEFLFNLPTSLPTIYMFTIYITYPSVSMHIFSSIFDLVSLLIYSFLLVFSVKRCTHNSTAFARNVLSQAAAQRCNSNAQNFSLNTWLRWTAHP